MKPLIIILFMNLVIVNIQGQNITNDSICVYSTNISELSEFLNRKIEIYKNEPDSLVHKDFKNKCLLKCLEGYVTYLLT
jgi:hypothetical protein